MLCAGQVVVEAKDGINVNPLRWYVEDYVVSNFGDDCHPVASKPIR
jgi:hypothetical protein